MATWPATLPKPSYSGYKLAPVEQTIRTEMEVGAPRARRISSARNDRITLVWEMSDSQMQIFRTWFSADAAGGAAWFSLELAIGETGIEFVDARFASVYTADLLPGMRWQVAATLEIR